MLHDLVKHKQMKSFGLALLPLKTIRSEENFSYCCSFIHNVHHLNLKNGMHGYCFYLKYVYRN